MKIGLDFDGCLDHIPEFFRVLADAFITAGHEIHVITYRDRASDTVGDLRRMGIRFTQVHVPEDYLKVDAPEWKAEVAKKLGIDVMFEDSLENLAAMPPRVRRVWVADPEVFNLDDAIQGMKDGLGTQ